MVFGRDQTSIETELGPLLKMDLGTVSGCGEWRRRDRQTWGFFILL